MMEKELLEFKNSIVALNSYGAGTMAFFEPMQALKFDTATQ